MRRTVIASGTVASLVLAAVCANVAHGASAADILSATGIRGGLVVHVGCGDGKLTAALRASDSYLVHGLDTNAANVTAAREHIRKAGVYGKVSIARLASKALPYIDNSVNLVVSENLGAVPADEVMRVLCPNGVAYVKTGDRLGRRSHGEGGWTKTVKPRPKEIDEWTHYMHDASGNAVAHDSVVAPPRRLQWIGSPVWARHHDHMSSVSAVVSAGGRVFYIMDEGSRVSILLPPKWVLIARDAFNGTVLWKRPIAKWFSHMMRLKSGPAVLPRRLVAVGDRVYVTLGLDAPLTALDAATGKTVRTYEGTDNTHEIIASEGTLLVVVGGKPPAGNAPALWALTDKRVVAMQAESGKRLWQARSPVLPMTLACDAKRAYFHNGEKIVALDRASGKPLWTTAKPIPRTSKLQSFYGATLVVTNDVVLFSGGETAGGQTGKWYAKGTDTLTALSADTGKTLWTDHHPASGYRSPEDVLVIDNTVWVGQTTSGNDPRYAGHPEAKYPLGVMIGYDLKTGKVVSRFTPDVETYWFHHRCYRGKATDKYLLMSRAGTEFIDHKAKHWITNHWVRGACLYGVMPANGLLYAPPHPCACYPEAKQFGFTVVAPAAKVEGQKSKVESPRLQRGPAYGKNPKSEIRNPQSSDWPTYRGDAARGGWAKTPVPPKLTEAWQAEIAGAGKLSSVVVAEGKLFVASVDDHTVHAINAATGKEAWRFTAGGRVDSPPTICAGRAIFGCADGHVYCLRTADGALVWRFRAAPTDRRLVSFEQVESVWPVHGSVLVTGGRVSFVAGRSMFLDGGLRLIHLDPETGELLRETVLDDRDPASDDAQGLQKYVRGLDMPVALPDILSSDGTHLYMRSQRFDMVGKRQDIAARAATAQTGEGAHLFSPTGFLDDAYWHRSYWVYGRTFSGGYSGYSQAGKHAPAGKILVTDDTTVYGFGRKAKYFRWTTPIEHHLFADAKGQLRGGSPARKGAATNRGAWISIANSPSLDPTGKAVAVEAWVKASRGDGVVLARGGNLQGYALVLRGGVPSFVIRAETKLSEVTAKAKVVGKWVHLAGVLGADKTLKLFVDGKLAATAAGTGLMTAEPAQPMEIGADDGGAVGEYPAPGAFAGLIDEVRVFHGTVSDDEIAAHAATGGKIAAKDATLVLCMSFDDGKASDASGKANHGAVGGSTSVAGKFGKARQLGAPTGGAKGKAKPSRKRRGAAPAFAHRWARDVPLIVRAMVLADKTLFIAGPPDLLDEEKAKTLAPAQQAHIAAQAASLAGKKGSLLWAVSATDGTTLAEYTLKSLPVFDSLIAAGGRLYWATTDGRIICYAAK